MMERSALTACPTNAISAMPPGAMLMNAVKKDTSCQRLNKKLSPTQPKSRHREVNNDHKMNLPIELDDEKFIMKLK